jgi:serine protease AprX
MTRLTVLPILLAAAATTASAAELQSGTREAGGWGGPRAEFFAHVAADRRLVDADGNRLFDNLEARMATAAADQALPVIVRYKPGRQPASIAAVRGAKKLALDDSVALPLTPAQIRALVASGAVESVEKDEIFSASRESANASFGATKAAADFGLTGDGDGSPTSYSAQDLTIAVIDTGIDGGHQDFAGGKIIGWKDFVGNRTQPYDDDGHGTHVASIAAGAVNAQGVSGVAPGASLVGVKVLGADGNGTAAGIIQGVEWCIQNRARYGIDVINMSLGGEGSSDGTDAVSRAVNRAVAAGMVVCVAAGNEGPGSYTVSTPGAAADVVTVGNMVDVGKGGFALALSSSHGPTADGRVKPDLCGPGYQILAAEANSGDGYTRMTGTSMATPFVAGIAALVLQANPKLSPAEVKALLKGTAVHFGRQGENNEYGAGRLDGYAAIAKAAGKTAPGVAVLLGPAVPHHLHATSRLESEGQAQSWSLPITDTRFPISVTVITGDDKADFDLQLLDPQGIPVLQATAADRQEWLSFQPRQNGVYVIVVRAYKGAGEYTIDVSAN